MVAKSFQEAVEYLEKTIDIVFEKGLDHPGVLSEIFMK